MWSPFCDLWSDFVKSYLLMIYEFMIRFDEMWPRFNNLWPDLVTSDHILKYKWMQYRDYVHMDMNSGHFSYAIDHNTAYMCIWMWISDRFEIYLKIISCLYSYGNDFRTFSYAIDHNTMYMFIYVVNSRLFVNVFNRNIVSKISGNDFYTFRDSCVCVCVTCACIKLYHVATTHC